MAYGQKTGGRTAGTPNKVTTDVKSRIAALIDERFDTILSDLNELEPKERVAVYLKFLEYILPKQREQIIREAGNTIVRRDKITGDIVIETVDDDEDES